MPIFLAHCGFLCNNGGTICAPVINQDLVGLTPISTANILLDRGDQELSFEVLVAIIGALGAEIWLLKVGACIGSEFMLTRALSSFTTKRLSRRLLLVVAIGASCRGDQELYFEVLVAILGALVVEIWLFKVEASE